VRPAVGSMRALFPVLVLLFCGGFAGALSAQAPAFPPAGDAQALDEPDPNEQIRIYKEILKLDPNNQNAFNGIKQAQDKIDNDRKQASQREDDQRKQEQQQSENARKQSQAIADANAALDRNDPAAARVALETAEKIGLANPEISALAGRVTAMQNFRQRLYYAALALAVAGVGAVVALILGLRGKRLPYIEVVDGSAAGKRYEITKPVTLIGSTEDYGGGANDIVVHDPDGLIAEAQCEIHEKAGRHYLLDCDSPHGTAADGKSVSADRPVLLRKDSVIVLAGVSTLRFGLEKEKK
jgi:hypothetical protein